MKLGLIVLAAFLLKTGEISAQSDLAAITGTVTDMSGAVIVGAKVIATNPGNNLQSTTATIAVGEYALLNLPIGQYTLTCSKDGFAQHQRAGINLAIGQVVAVTTRRADFDSHINGSLSSTKEVMIDGTSAVSQIGSYLSESSPPMGAVQEFQVTSAGVRADDGFSGPNTQIGTPGFGTVLPQDLNGLPGPRVGQFGARFGI